VQHAQLEGALAGLAEVRETFVAASRGEASPSELMGSVATYLGEHGPTLRQAGAAVGEEVRRQLLGGLQQWREQLIVQLDSQGSHADPPDRTVDAITE
jgi:hypothetical protein